MARKHCGSVVVSDAASGMCNLTNQRLDNQEGGLEEIAAKTNCFRGGIQSV